jgi:hypothetical protein
MKLIPKIACLTYLTCFSLSALATLGQPASSINQDKESTHATNLKQVNVSASISSTTNTTNYTVQQLTEPAGQIVYEYINTGGIVFAVSWSGPIKPDLSTLLGNYFAELNQSKSPSHTFQKVTTSDVVISSTGRLRSFKGFAYVPSLTPVGFTFPNLQNN